MKKMILGTALVLSALLAGESIAMHMKKPAKKRRDVEILKPYYGDTGVLDLYGTNLSRAELMREEERLAISEGKAPPKSRGKVRIVMHAPSFTKERKIVRRGGRIQEVAARRRESDK